MRCFLVAGGVLTAGVALTSPVQAFPSPCGIEKSCNAGGGVVVVFRTPGSGIPAPRPVAVPAPVVAPRVQVARPLGSRGGVSRAVSGASSGPSAAQQVADAVDVQVAGVCAALPGSPCEVSAAAAAAARAAMTVPSPTAARVRPVSVAPSANPVAAAPPPPKVTPVQAAAQAWTTQPFAAAHVTMQPVGNETLTGLPTYFQATFPGAGLAPGEQVSATVLGQTVTIRPASAQYTYDFGDGTSQGPTPDAGGPYPDGHITHIYEKPATVTVRIDVTLTGEFQVAGGAWEPIPGSTTVRGVPQQLQVEVMQSRLDSDDGTNTVP